MKLPDITDLVGKKDKEEIFACFVIGKNWVQGGIWQIREGKGEIITVGTTDAWHDEDSFIQAADDSLSAAFGRFEKSPEQVDKVVFGLPFSWVEDGEIKKEKVDQLRNLCQKLELKPAGFVVIPEAIIYFLKTSEGAPVSCILAGIEEEELEVMLVRSGKIVQVQTVSRSLSLPDDITEGLSRFGISEPLPARIIIYNRSPNELEEAMQNLLSWEWPSPFFLHTPRVETLTDEALLSALSLAAGAEISGPPEFAKEPVQKQALGVGEEEEATRKVEPLVNAQEFGFQEEAKEVEIKPSQIQEQRKTVGLIGSLVAFLGKISFVFPAIPFRSGFRLFLGFLVLLLIGFGLFFWFVPQAEVKVYVAPKKLEENFVLSVDPTNPKTTAQDVVGGRVASTDVSGEKTIETTGTKTVGDRARGEVTVFNNTVQAKTFAAGTVIIGPNGLKFTLDAPVPVASASGVPPVLGQAKANATASDIGSEYNLAGGSPFSVANFATISFSAKNNNPLTGGSSREVAAVSKADQEELEKELIGELETKAKEQIESGLGVNETIISESVKINPTRRTFSANAGEEAETLKLSLTAVGQVVVVSEDNLNSTVLAVLKDKVSSGFTLSEQISTHIVPMVREKEEKEARLVRFQVTVVADLLPSIDKKLLSSQLRGKDPKNVREKLAEIPGYTRSSVKFIPSLPIITSRFPQRAGNITITLITEQ